MADEAVHIGPPPANQSYIVIDKILAAIRATGAEAVHPGYGFLSERADFARALEAAGVAFIGPPVGAIEAMGDKITSKKLAAEAGVSTVPGHMGLIDDAGHAAKIAAEIGYPVMIKASAGGGGKGMRIAWNDAEAREGFERSKSEAASSFGDDRIFIEKFVTQPRHIEIQVLGDKHGNCLYLGERECSIQRRNQKVIEEAPSPFLDAETRKAMGEQAVALAKAVDYCSAGTVEFIVDGSRNFYFLEMNTRLQVEHPVTELITGIDLVEQMIRVAAGEKLAFGQDDVRLDGWAIESRLYAEDPYRNFLPSIGRLTRYRPPVERKSATAAVRNDTGVFEGGEISMYYDPMIAKLCTWAPTRAEAIEAMRDRARRLRGRGHRPQPAVPVGGDGPSALHRGRDHHRLHRRGVSRRLPGRDARRRRCCGGSRPRRRRCTGSPRSGGRGSPGKMDNHERRVGGDWVVTLQKQSFPVTIDADRTGATVTFADGAELRVASDWTPGQPLARLEVDGELLVLKVGRQPGGFRARLRGADLSVSVLSPRLAELAALMPEKLPPDTSKLLLCPMPGLVVRIDVAEGDEVFDGQPLAMVEAMKMENVLRAERKARVAKVHAKPGDSLAVDEVILEFE